MAVRLLSNEELLFYISVCFPKPVVITLRIFADELEEIFLALSLMSLPSGQSSASTAEPQADEGTGPGAWGV